AGPDAGDDHVRPAGDPSDRPGLLRAGRRVVRARRRLGLTPLHAGPRGRRPRVQRVQLRLAVEVRLGVLRECPDENRGGAEGPDPPQRGARAHDTRAPVRRRALAGQGVPRRELPAAPRHVREGRRLRLGDRGAGARAGLRRPLQGARCARDRPGGPARRPAVLHPRDVQQGRGRADPVRRSGIVMPALLGALLLLRAQRDGLLIWASFHGAREDFARFYTARLRLGDREVEPAFVQNERTAVRKDDGRYLARCVYGFATRNLTGTSRVALVVRDADGRDVGWFTIDLSTMR